MHYNEKETIKMYKEKYGINLDDFQAEKYENPIAMWEDVANSIYVYFEGKDKDKSHILEDYWFYDADVYTYCYLILKKSMENNCFYGANIITEKDILWHKYNDGRVKKRIEELYKKHELFDLKTDNGVEKLYGLKDNIRLTTWRYNKMLGWMKKFTLEEKIIHFLRADCKLTSLITYEIILDKELFNRCKLAELFKKDNIAFKTEIVENEEKKKKLNVMPSAEYSSLAFLRTQIEEICEINSFKFRYIMYYCYFSILGNAICDDEDIQENMEIRRIIYSSIEEININLKGFINGFLYCINKFNNWESMVDSIIKNKVEKKFQLLISLEDSDFEIERKICGDRMQVGELRSWENETMENEKIYALIQATVINVLEDYWYKKKEKNT